MTGVRRAGSSPLTRGKLGDRVVSGPGDGLIPAHAGKTVPNLGDITQVEAHPRSRGENRLSLVALVRMMGSSPLTRGKQRARVIAP